MGRGSLSSQADIGIPPVYSQTNPFIHLSVKRCSCEVTCHIFYAYTDNEALCTIEGQRGAYHMTFHTPIT